MTILQYYINESGTEGPTVSGFDLLNKGIFITNNSTPEAITTNNANQGSGSFMIHNYGENYTFFFTFESYKSQNHFKSQIILTDFRKITEEGDDFKAYILGVNSNNELFISNPLNSSLHTFGLKLGNKNCIVLKKMQNTFFVYLFDVISNTIQETEVFVMLDEPNYKIDDIYLLSPGGDIYKNSFEYFKGKIDKYVFTPAILDHPSVLMILKGFRKYYDESELQEIEEQAYLGSERSHSWGPEISKNHFLYGKTSKFIETFSKLDSGISTSNFRYGYSRGIEEGYINPGTLELSVGYYTGITGDLTFGGFISGTGLSLQISNDSSSTPNYSYISYLEINKKQDSQSTLISRKVCFSGQGNFGNLNSEPEYVLAYEALYRIKTPRESYAVGGLDSGYYSGFKFDGIFAYQNIYSGHAETRGVTYIGIGGNKDDIAATGYHKASLYDSFLKKFYMPENNKKKPEKIYLKGVEINGNIDAIDGFYFTPSVSVQFNPKDSIVYHNNNITGKIDSNRTANQNNYIIGKFWPRTSDITVGSTNTVINHLLIDTDYRETTTGNIYHGKNITKRGEFFIASL